LTLKRFYLDKGMEKFGVPNGKFRPIGAPSLISRVIAKALNDMVYYINEDRFMSFQHGYRLNRGCDTALYKVFENVFVHKIEKIYEFDFKGFFNNVKLNRVYEALKERSNLLAELIFSVIKNIDYQFDELKPETELRVIDPLFDADRLIFDEYAKGKQVIVRHGMPQGLSVSPLLATMVLESTKKKVPNLVMYADDGLIFGDKQTAF